MPAALDDALAQPLLAELAVEYAQRYGRHTGNGIGVAEGQSRRRIRATGRGHADRVCWTAVPVTGGGFRRFDAETAELKRIWTDSAHRRRGYAMALLAELEAEIAARGYRKVYLMTGNRQPEAEELYLATGYTRLAGPLPSQGPVFPIAFEKRLT